MSRLLDSSENEKARNFYESRNLYTPNDPYELNTSEVVNTINTLAKFLLPTKSININNSVIGRSFNLPKDNEPPTLSSIGNQMLLKQLGYTAASGAVASYFPTMTFDPFNGNFGNLTLKKDFKITKRKDEGKFSKFFQDITNSYKIINPFNEYSSNINVVRETGKAQLELLGKNLNENWYVNSNKEFLDILKENKIEIKTFPNLNVTENNKYYFSFLPSDKLFSPYNYFPQAALSNVEMRFSEKHSREIKSGNNITSTGDRTYADDIENSIKEHGVVDKSNNNFINEYGLSDSIDNRIIWGRDGIENDINIESTAFKKNAQLRGDSDAEILLTPNKLNEFNARRGLLKYTSELLNASEGNFVDQTRKLFKSSKDGSIVGKQGSGLLIPPDNNYTKAMENNPSNGGSGIRQHTVIDQYNRFEKTIRFEGNYVYQGHENSVINNTVMPNIAPIKHNVKDQFSPENNQNKNLMFSIENLAFELDNDNTLKADLYDKPMQFPSCQKGGNGGRLMWFAPYDIDVTEQAVARYTDTQFIGRGEPVYTYSNSERILTLNFKLLMDHPPQSTNRKSDRDVREFFQFGGDTEVGEKELKNLPQLKRKGIKLRYEINKLKGDFQIKPIPDIANDFNFYFPNNEPFDIGSLEIYNIINSKYELSNFGINEKYPKNYGSNDTFENNLNNLIDNFLNEKNANQYVLNIIGWTSELHTSNYNKKLGLRRARSMQEYIKDKIFDRWNVTAEELGVKFNVTSQGEVNDITTESKESINTENAVLARKTTINLSINDINKKSDSLQLSPDEKKIIVELEIDLQKVEKDIKIAKGYDLRKSTSCGFKRYKKENKQQLGYDSFITVGGQADLLQPIFYSQTPKDFHDRLTFLHQCTRQGPPIRRYEKKQGANGSVTEVSVSAKNSVFGRQPICVLRLGDQWHTKVIIENIQFSYSNSPWDTNPEGYGMQFMSADISMQMKVIGGESMVGPISVLQNAVTFNYYANSTYAKDSNFESNAAYEFEKLEYGNDKEQINKSNDNYKLREINQDKQ